MKTKAALTSANTRPRSGVLAAELAVKQQEHRAASTELDRLKAARPNLLRTATDAELDAHDRAAAKASRTVERAAALESDLRSQLGAVQAAEEDDRRRAVYARGLRAAEAYRKLLEEDYAALAKKIAAVLRNAQEQLDIVAAANNELPVGKTALDADRFRESSQSFLPEVRLPGVTYWDEAPWDQTA